MKLDEICNQLSKEVVIFIKEWLRISSEDETAFHKYRMKLLDMAAREGTDVKSKLFEVCRRSGARVHFEIKQVVSDKLIGETTASYIFAKLIQSLNYEYQDIMEREAEIIKRENEQLKTRIDNMGSRLGVH